MWPERNYVTLHRYLLAIATRWLQISYHYSVCVINAYVTPRMISHELMNCGTNAWAKNRENLCTFAHMRQRLGMGAIMCEIACVTTRWFCDEMWPEKVFTVRHLHLLSVEPQKENKRLEKNPFRINTIFHLSFNHFFFQMINCLRHINYFFTLNTILINSVHSFLLLQGLW